MSRFRGVGGLPGFWGGKVSGRVAEAVYEDVHLGRFMQPDRDDISYDNVCYFFDSNRRDALDRGVLSRRAGQFLALRDKLLGLTDEQFEMAMRTLESMLTPPNPTKAEPGAERRAAIELFKRASASELNPAS